MDKPFLRRTLKKLRAQPLDGTNQPNPMMAPQEMLDFLVVRTGLQAVVLTIGSGQAK